MNEAPRSSVLARVGRFLPESLRHPAVLELLRLSVAEDTDPDGTWQPGHAVPAERDVTSRATIGPEARLDGQLAAKEDGIVAGLPLAEALFAIVDEQLTIDAQVEEGACVEAGRRLATVSGPGRALLAAERPALNVMGRLSGIATLTRRYVDAVAHTDAQILDTRKTLPGSRRPDKYAVRQGGGANHRMGLFDMVLVKENHIAAAGGIPAAVRRVRDRYGDQYPVEVEVSTLDELADALGAAPDAILLDNMEPSTLRRAVDRTDGRIPLEASGNVTLGTVATVAETGIDRISVGALTHSASTLDLSIRTDA